MSNAGGASSGGTSSEGGRTAVASGGTNQAGAPVAGVTSSGGQAGKTGAGGQVGAGAASGGDGGTTSGGSGAEAGGQAQGGGGQAGGGSGGQVGGNGAGGSPVSACVGKDWPTADPTVAGPFEVAADKKVGPLAGYLPDPTYGDEQQRFNVYRPKNLADSGYCHPVLVWANGHTDNPEPNPPKCIVDAAANRWCGTYPMLMDQLASHGFVVIASLSTTTSKGDPMPTIVGLNWLLEQAEDPASPYYHRLDTAHIGALGHSEGGMSTCKAAPDPRIKAIATICGTSALTVLNGPALFFCGDKDTVAKCDGIQKNFATVKDQPAMFVNNLAADHGSWLGQNGPKGPTIFGVTAWFRVHLMGDTANRKYFYGSSCTFCSDNRVKVERNDLMTQ
jgi:hypothetical protein